MGKKPFKLGGKDMSQYREPGFSELVLTVAAGAIETLLKEERERDLNIARFSIDLLKLLKEKTKGNLNEDERNFLQGVIHELQLKYVEQLKSSKGGNNGKGKNISDS